MSDAPTPPPTDDDPTDDAVYAPPPPDDPETLLSTGLASLEANLDRGGTTGFAPGTLVVVVGRADTPAADVLHLAASQRPTVYHHTTEPRARARRAVEAYATDDTEVEYLWHAPMREDTDRFDDADGHYGVVVDSTLGLTGRRDDDSGPSATALATLRRMVAPVTADGTDDTPGGLAVVRHPPDLPPEWDAPVLAAADVVLGVRRSVGDEGVTDQLVVRSLPPHRQLSDRVFDLETGDATLATRRSRTVK